MTLESTIERAAVRYARERGAMMPKFSDPGRIGAPDRVVLGTGGRMVFIEFKRPGGKVSDHQLRYHAALVARGFAVHVVSDLTTAKRLIDAVTG